MNLHPMADWHPNEPATDYVPLQVNKDHQELSNSLPVASRRGLLSSSSLSNAISSQSALTPAKQTVKPGIRIFDYSGLDLDAAVTARNTADRIHARLKAFHIDIGRDLLAVKTMMPHGQFGAWLEAEFRMSHRTAERYMNAAQFLKDKSDSVSHLSPTSLYALSSSSANITIVNEIVAEIDAGKSVSTAEIKKRLAGATKAQIAAKAIEAAEQNKKNRKNEKRRQVAEQDKQKHAQKCLENIAPLQEDYADEAASFLIDCLSKDDVAKFERLMQGTDWHRVIRSFRIKARSISTSSAMTGKLANRGEMTS